MPPSLNLPSVRFCAASGRSPCRTWTSTSVWLSAAVEKVSVFLVGMVVLRWNHGRGDAAEGLDGQGQRRHVEQQQILDLAGQHARLHGRADGDDFIGVDAAMRLACRRAP